jgi:hypothetical protein
VPEGRVENSETAESNPKFQRPSEKLKTKSETLSKNMRRVPAKLKRRPKRLTVGGARAEHTP